MTNVALEKLSLGAKRAVTAALIASVMATQGMSMSAFADPAERDPSAQGPRGAPLRQGAAPPQQRQVPPGANVIGRIQSGPPPQAARPAPPPQVARQAPPPAIFTRQAPQVYARPSGPPPRYETRRYDNDDRRRDRRYSPGVAIGVGAVIIGATLGYRYYRGPNRESVYDRCDRNFAEFDYDNGTFTNEDGDRELCPYLRPYVD